MEARKVGGWTRIFIDLITHPRKAFLGAHAFSH
jgi:hypothetical protein